MKAILYGGPAHGSILHVVPPGKLIEVRRGGQVYKPTSRKLGEFAVFTTLDKADAGLEDTLTTWGRLLADVPA